MTFRFFILWLLAMVFTILWILLPNMNEGQGDQLATLFQTRGQVTLRRSGDMFWGRSDRGAPLFAYDSIATEVDSEAMLRLQDGSMIVIPAGAQLKFVRKKLSQDIEIALIKGGIRVQVDQKSRAGIKSKQPKITLVTPQYKIDLSTLNGDFELTKEAEIATPHPETIIVRGAKESLPLSDLIKSGIKLTIPESLRPPDQAAQDGVPRIDQASDRIEMSLPEEERSEPSSGRGEESDSIDKLKPVKTFVDTPPSDAAPVADERERPAAQDDRLQIEERERAIEQILTEPPAKPLKTKPPVDLGPYAMPIVPGQQQALISFSWKGETHSARAAQEAQWRAFCDKLSRNLIYPTSQRGFLSKASCLGIDARVNAGKGAPWKIKFTASDAEFRVEVAFDAGQQPSLVLNIAFAYEGDLMESLQDAAAPVLMAGMLMEGLPTGWILPARRGSEKVEFVSPQNQPSTPRELLVYDLFYDTQHRIWIRQAKTHLLRGKQAVEADGMRHEVYTFAQESAPVDPDKLYWTQNLDGPNARKNYYSKLISQTLPSVSLLDASQRLLLSQFKSSFLGFRYGRSPLSGTAIVNHSSLLSVLMEMRSGWLSGLRLYYDSTPRLKRGNGEDTEYFSMNRASIGWNFAYKAPRFLEPLISRFDIQPKIGIMNLNYRFSYPVQDERPLYLKFVAKNAYDLALELGLEKDYPWLRTRLWGAYSVAKFGLSQRNRVSVESSRVGLDTYFDVSRWTGAWNVHLMSFAVGEMLSLSKTSDALSYDDNLGISSVSFGVFFLGGGFTLAW